MIAAQSIAAKMLLKKKVREDEKAEQRLQEEQEVYTLLLDFCLCFAKFHGAGQRPSLL